MQATTIKPSDSIYRWYVVGVLIVAYIFSYIDRTILTLLVDPIRKSLDIGDVGFSLLHGLAFAIFYTFLGLPIGRLVDQRKRTNIIAIGVALWSVMTSLCGFARSFGQMFLARVGVGVGEAALSPAAYSILSDYFSGKDLVRALSLYTGSIYVGAGLATIAGGALIAFVPAVEIAVFGTMEPWRVVFVMVGVPGLLIAYLVARLREPTRTGRSSSADTAAASFATVFRYIAEKRGSLGLLIIGYSIASTVWNGVIAWIPTYFIRAHGWTPTEVAVRYGVALLTFGTIGIIFGGWIAGRMRERGHLDANIRIGVLSAACALPFGVLAPLMTSGGASLVLLCGFLFCAAMPYGGAAAALQEITPNEMRGQISAVYLFGLNLAGIGLGPTLVALLTTHLFGQDIAVGRSIAIVVGVAAPLSAAVLFSCRTAYVRALKERAGSLLAT